MSSQICLSKIPLIISVFIVTIILIYICYNLNSIDKFKNTLKATPVIKKYIINNEKSYIVHGDYPSRSLIDIDNQINPYKGYGHGTAYPYDNNYQTNYDSSYIGFKRTGFLAHPNPDLHLQLFEREKNNRTDYHTIHHNTGIYIPIKNKNRVLENGESVMIDGYDDEFKVHIYDSDNPFLRY
jgi:hypothetical protein